MTRKIICLLIVLAAMTCAACNAASVRNQKETEDFIAMDTLMSITCYGENAKSAVDAAKQEIERLDTLLSTGKPSSEVSLVNENGFGVLSEDAAALMDFSLKINEATDGAFDVTVYPVMKLWGFTGDNPRVPSETELDNALDKCGSSKVLFDRVTGKLSLDDGGGIDFGGIAKGYASDRLRQIFEDYGVESAIASLGGNIITYRKKPDGSEWNVAIENPFTDSSEKYVGSLRVSDLAVVTSGAYERFFYDEAADKTYHHIIDPETGYPADSGIASVTIVSESGTLADALSTSFYVMGIDKSVNYWQNNKEKFDFIIVTSDMKVYVSEKLMKKFVATDSFRDVCVIE